MVNAQEWLDENYPKQGGCIRENENSWINNYGKTRKQITRLDIRWKKLESELDLSNFSNLVELYCSDNKLTSLDISNCLQLKEFYCSDNKLTDLDLTGLKNLEKFNCEKNYLTNLDFLTDLNPNRLIWLNISKNKIFKQSLTVISKFFKLERLYIDNNLFTGSLAPLQNCSNLKHLTISNTDIDSGLEYLPENLSFFSCSVDQKSDSEVRKIAEQLYPYGYDDSERLKNWKEWNKKGLSQEEIKKWMSIGLIAHEYDFAYYLQKKKRLNSWELEKDSLVDLRKKYYNITDNKISSEVIKQLKKFIHSYDISYKLTPEQKLLIKQLIPNEELKKRYECFGLCKECNQPNTGQHYGDGWHQPCNAQHFQQEFKNWSSDNKKIDKFIQKSQLEATNQNKFLEWIPYYQFTSIEYLAIGGFGTVSKAMWIDGPIKNWNTEKNRWERNIYRNMVALKMLNNSQNLTKKFLQEITYHNSLADDWDIVGSIGEIGAVVPCYGISQDPETKNYMIVMQLVEFGSIRNFLSEYHGNLVFESKLHMLFKIAYGLKEIHNKGLIHKDLHLGNILGGYGSYCITDLGLCRPVDEKDNSKVYGVLPYVAPEVLRGQPYTQASDIYSFGIIACEIITELPPYYNLPYNELLGLRIVQGLRPKFEIKIPQLLADLVRRSWDADPSKRPSAEELSENLNNWCEENDSKKYNEFIQQLQESEACNKNLSKEISYLKYQDQEVRHSQLINTQQIVQLFQEAEEKALQEELKKIEREIDQPLTAELKELVSKFIQTKKLTIQDEENEAAEDKAWDLEDQLKEQGLSKENIEKIIKYCERFIKAEQQFEEELQTNIEIPANQ